MTELGMMGIVPFFTYYLFSVIPLAALVYLFLKWRSYRDGAASDPHLGKKVVFHYFKTLAYHILLIALTLIIVGILKGEYPEEMQVGLGLFIGGGLVFGICYLLKSKLGNSYLVCRVYAGFNLIIVGIVAMTCLLAVCIILIKGRWDNIKLPVSGLIIYGIAGVFQAFFFLDFPRISGSKPQN